MFGMKKFMVSKLGDTKLGRAAVLKYAGETGDRTMKSLKSAAHKVSGHTTAKDLKRKTMKLIAKLALLYDNGKLSEKHLNDVQEKMHGFAEKATEIFNADQSLVKPTDVKDLQKLMQSLNGALKTLADKNMTSKNLVLFDEVIGFYSSSEFLDKLIFDEELRSEKRSLGVYLKSMGNPLEASTLHIPCSYQHCEKSRIGVPGSDYCATHHELRLSEILKEPKVRDFLGNDEYRKYFESYLHSRGCTALIAFHHAVESFKKITNKNLVKPRAHAIYFKHLSTTGEQRISSLDEKVVAEVLESIDSESGPNKRTFVKVSLLVEGMIEQEFLLFQKAEQFEAFKVRCGPEAAKSLHLQIHVHDGKYDDSDSDGYDSDDSKDSGTPASPSPKVNRK